MENKIEYLTLGLNTNLFYILDSRALFFFLYSLLLKMHLKKITRTLLINFYSSLMHKNLEEMITLNQTLSPWQKTTKRWRENAKKLPAKMREKWAKIPLSLSLYIYARFNSISFIWLFGVILPLAIPQLPTSSLVHLSSLCSL